MGTHDCSAQQEQQHWKRLVQELPGMANLLPNSRRNYLYLGMDDEISEYLQATNGDRQYTFSLLQRCADDIGKNRCNKDLGELLDLIKVARSMRVTRMQTKWEQDGDSKNAWGVTIRTLLHNVLNGHTQPHTKIGDI